ncbi:MAG: tetratricopeptide repeat protein [Flavobacteriales bacterium]
MKPSNELFDLIKSLSKSEKRFFKLQSALQSGDKNYVRLFDTIDRMVEYNEEHVKQVFKGEKFIRHLPSEKNHLYKLILKALRSYYGDTSISSILKQEIKNIEILYNRALFDECNKFLIRAKKLAVQYEKFYYLFELINWEKTLLEEAFEDGQFTKDLDLLIREEQEVIDKLRNLAAYHVLYSKINYVFRSGGYARTEENRAIVEEIVNHPLIKGKNTALSRRAASICYYTQAFCNMANGDFATAITKFSRVRDILDEHQHLRVDLAKRYIRTLANLIQCQITLGQHDQARENIFRMRAMDGQDGFNHTDVQVSIFRHAGLAELEISRLTGDYVKGIHDAEELMKLLSEYEGRLHKEAGLHFYYQFACVYFGAGQYNKALYWINKVLNDNENTLRQDLYSYARLFNLAIHYELGNFDLLEYTIKSTLRYLQKRERDFPLEKTIIDYFKKLIRTPQQDRAPIFRSFRKEMEHLSKSPENEVVLRYFDLVKWIDFKLEKVSAVK